MELTAPTTALVIGFPLVMMLVMLAMNTVERWLTSPRRAPLRLAPDGPADGTGGEAPGGGAGDGQPATATPEPTGPLEAIADRVAATGGDGGLGHPAVAEPRPALHLVDYHLVDSAAAQLGAPAFDAPS